MPLYHTCAKTQNQLLCDENPNCRGWRRGGAGEARWELGAMVDIINDDVVCGGMEKPRVVHYVYVATHTLCRGMIGGGLTSH